MDFPPKEGPDGSSIRPVSSLLARFESMNNAAPPSPQSTSRPISPSPRPDRPPISTQSTGTSSPFPSIAVKPPILKPKPPVKPKPLSMQQLDAPPIPQATKPSLPDTPIVQSKVTPAVTILPPQSPPKTSLPTVAGDQSPFLDASAIPDEHPARSPSPLSVASRPLTPTPIGLGISRTSRNASPKPPSPPPPRRSGELRRDRDFKLTPVLSATKPALPPPGHNPSEDRQSHIIASEISPFTSPPSSPEVEQEEAPPQLPSRPRPSQSDAAVRYRPQQDIFAPPPKHHAAQTRQHKELQLARTPHQQDARPALPARRQTHHVITPVVSSVKATAPPRPPRTIVNHIDQYTPGNSGHNSPISSSVPSGAQFLPPPTRAHVRSKTTDLSASDTAVEVYAAPDTKTNASSTTIQLADISNTNRRPPYIKKGCYEIHTKYEPRKLDVCGDFVCTTGHYTRGWSMMDGEQLTSQAHTEGVKATAIAFKPSADPSSEGSKVWVGTNAGDLMELDVLANRIVAIRSGVHGRTEVLRIHRYYNELWSLDEAGNLLIWGPQNDGMPDLNQEPAQSYKVPRGHTFSIVVDGEFWHVAGRTIRVFEPSLDGSGTFQVLIKPIAVEGAGDVNAGAFISTDKSRVYFGHNDGKVSVYSTESHACEKIIHVSGWRINSMTAVGSDLWLGHNTGKICIYDTSTPTWNLRKEWQAHENTVHQLKYDPASSFLLDRLQVVSVGGDGKIKVWDGLLQDDRLKKDLQDNEQGYCTYDNLKALVMTWNAGASTPHSLRYSQGDGAFFQDLLRSSGSPDILVFGFQELVDLEDKTATAKRLLKSKKRDDSERMSHQYRDWRDFLLKSLDDYMPSTDLYHLLHTAPLVGLFTCVFVKSSLQGRIRNVHGAEVKRGMGGLHGNKGALAVRFQVDDSSLCFVNCHLAAGQSQTSSRHADVAAILEANLFPTESDPDQRLDSFVCGGDGGMIVDHESCILNGDLNYRIDTMSRDTVVKAVRAGNLSKLLDRDQLLAARRKNPAFRLRAFHELPIQFNPTYKYDVGTDDYDTSEKRRSPAWCDRLLFRGQDTVQQLDYRRHEVRVSDHRPVTGSFKIRTKKVNNNERATLRMECQQRLEQHLQAALAAGRLYYLENVCGFDEPSSKIMIKERLAGKR